MYIYRDHRGSLDSSMQTACEFKTLDEMFQHIIRQHSLNDIQAFGLEDIVIDEKSINDTRIGWEDCRYVCVKRYYGQIYSIPQCIGMMATKYK